MGLFDNLFDKREKRRYGEILHFFFDIAQMQKVEYPEQFGDISAKDYQEDIMGIFAAYLDTKPKQKCVISAYGSDMFTFEIGCVSREVKEKVLPLFKEAYKHYGDFVKSNMGGAINASTIKTLATEVCQHRGITPDSARLNAIAMDINVMIGIIDATFETFRFV